MHFNIPLFLLIVGDDNIEELTSISVKSGNICFPSFISGIVKLPENILRFFNVEYSTI